MTHTQHTPGCQGIERDWFFVSDRNRRIGKNKFHYLRCDDCGLIRLENVPSNLGEYYPADYYELPTIDQLSLAASEDTFKIDTVQSFKSGGNLLEIGPAYGVFAYQAKKAGFNVDVIEMSEICCNYLNKIVGVNALCSSSPHEAISEIGSHDVIALWHVIEHLTNPWALLRSVAENLNSNGILVLAAPNPDAWQFHVMGKNWPHLDAPRHVYLLPVETITHYLLDFGLERIHYTTTDHDAKHWNRFGWQRFLMNNVRGKWLERTAFIMGYVLSIILAPFESYEPKGSAYTLVFRKVV